MKSIADEIIKLQRLKESGILTQDEFNTLKNRILSDEANNLQNDSDARKNDTTNIKPSTINDTIVINNIEISPKEINTRLVAGKRSDVVRYITGRTKCTTEEANEIIKNVQQLSKEQQRNSNVNVTKSEKTMNIDPPYYGQFRADHSIHCPNCGSTNVKKISATKRLFSAELFGLASSSIGKQFQCMEKNCGYKW